MNGASQDFDLQESFPNTNREIVAKARSPETPEGRAALDELYRTYQPKLVAWLRRRFALSEFEAEEVFSDFLYRKLVNGYLSRMYDPRKGLFRSLLYVALRSTYQDWLRAKRPGAQIEEWDLLPDERPSPQEQVGLWTAYEKAVEQTRDDCKQAGLDRYLYVLDRLIVPNVEQDAGVKPADLVGHAGFRKAADVYTAKLRVLKKLANYLQTAQVEVHGNP